jgi:ubiquinone/menaquinone biosynthesis C-methylase UbiE
MRGLDRVFYRLPKPVQNIVARRWYALLSELDRDADVTHMNNGWESLDGPAEPRELLPEDEPHRLSIQLYHHIAGAVDVRGKDVLEVGCGRGGGASYVMRYLGPRSYLGLDITRKGVAFCQRHYHIPGLRFMHGRAEALDLPSESFDVVINIESSNSYDSMRDFLSGVRRVLRPGGHFLYSDMRNVEDLEALRRDLRGSGMEYLSEEDITANVVKSLDKMDASRRAVMKKISPRIILPLMNEFVSLPGTSVTYGKLASRDRIFLNCVLRKPGY